MIANYWKKGLVWGLVIVALLASINVGARRWQFEHASDHVTLAVSSQEIDRLSILGGISRSELLYKLKEEVGITAIAVEEETIEDYIEEGRLTLLKGSEIMNLYRVGHVNRYVLTNLYKKVEVKPQYFYLIIEKKEDYEHIRDVLTAEFGRENVHRIGQLNILEVLDEKDDLLTIGLGLSPSTVTELLGYEFTIIPRLQNSRRLNRSVIALKFKSISQLNNNEPIVFSGQSALGFPSSLPEVQRQMADRGFRLGIVEFTNQRGVSVMAKANPLSVVRVHSIPEEVMDRIAVKKAVQRYVRAAKERGIHVLFLHPFFNVKMGNSVLDMNMLYFNQVQTELQRAGIELVDEIPSHPRDFSPAQPWEILLMSLGVLTVTCLLAQRFLSGQRLLFIAIATFLFALGTILVLAGMTSAWSAQMALLAAIVFPTYAVVALFSFEQNELPARVRQGLWYLVSVGAITLVGASLVVGLLSTPEYLLGIQRFSGVKLSFVVPLFLIWLYFFLHPNRIGSMFYVFKRMLFAPVRTVALLAALGCVFFIFVYILRSGNYAPFHIPIVEDGLRQFLESQLPVRPRTKEFLVGYPMLMLTFLFVGRGISKYSVWFFNGLGVVALISVMNTFCHFHTPLDISLVRSGLGVMLGLVVTGIYLAIAVLAQQVVKRVLQR